MDEIAARMEESKEKYGPTACSFYSFTGNQSKLAMQSATRFAGCYGATTWDIEGIMGDHGRVHGHEDGLRCHSWALTTRATTSRIPT